LKTTYLPEWSPVVEVIIIDAEIQVVSISGTSVKFKVLENDTKDPIFIRSCGYFVQNRRSVSPHIHSLFQMQMVMN
jgi:hypothetical protein